MDGVKNIINMIPITNIQLNKNKNIHADLILNASYLE